LNMKRSDWAGAAEHFEDAANIVDDSAMKSKALKNAAQAWLFAGNLSRADKVPKEALSGVEHGQIAMEMGIALATAGLHDRADQCYREAEERLRAGPADTRGPDWADRLLTALETNRAALAVRRGSSKTVAGNIAEDP